MTVRSAFLIAMAAAGVAAGQLAAVEPPPAVANLLAARADLSAGAPDRALERLSAAMPAAGELAAALRIDAAAVAVTLGRDPWPLLAPLLDRRAPAAQRAGRSDGDGCESPGLGKQHLIVGSSCRSIYWLAQRAIFCQ